MRTAVGKLYPTPTTINRTSRNSLIGIGEAHKDHGPALGLAQVAEITEGMLPKEYKTKDEIAPKWRDDYSPKEDKPGELNPDWVEWLMGWPIGWTAPEPLGGALTLPLGDDPADAGIIPRLAKTGRKWGRRIAALGNGQVPQCAAAAFLYLGQFFVEEVDI